MTTEINKENLPSIEDVVAEMASRGITSFSGDQEGSTEVDQPEIRSTDVKLGLDNPVDVGKADGQADTLPEAETQSESEPGDEEEVSQEGKPVERPSSAKYLEFLDQQEELRSRAGSLDEQKAEAEKQVSALQAEVEKLKSGAPKDPMEALMNAGFTYEDATKMVLQGWEPKQPDPVEEKVAPVLKQLEEAQKQIEELNRKIEQREAADRAKAADNARLSTLRAIEEIASAEEYPHINSFGEVAYSAVNDVLVEYYRQYKVALDINEACAIIESKYEEMLSPALKSERLRKKYGLSEESKKETTSETKPAKNRKTLTNTRSSSAPASPRIGEMNDFQAQEEVAKMLKFYD